MKGGDPTGDKDTIKEVNKVHRYTVPSNIIDLIKNAPSVNLFDKNLPNNQTNLALKFLGFLPKENFGPNYDPSKPTYVYIPPESFVITEEKPSVLTTIFAMETNDMTMPVPPKDYPFAIDPCPSGILCKKQSADNSLYMYIIIGVIVVILAMMLWR